MSDWLICKEYQTAVIGSFDSALKPTDSNFMEDGLVFNHPFIPPILLYKSLINCQAQIYQDQ